jgi:hypothetical protein
MSTHIVWNTRCEKLQVQGKKARRLLRSLGKIRSGAASLEEEMAKAVEEGAGVRVTHLLTDSGPFSADSAFGRRVAAADKDGSA